MNIWYFHHYGGGPSMGGHFRPYYLGQAWNRMGHRTTVFVARNHHLLDARNPLPDIFERDGLRYVALAGRPYCGNGLGRILNMADFVRAAYALPARVPSEIDPPDAIIASSPHPFVVFPAARLASRYGAQLTFEVRDLWPLSLTEINGTSKWHPFVRLTAFAERFGYAHADIVVSLLAGAEGHMRQKGLARGKFVYVPNGVFVEPHEMAGAPQSPVGKAAAQQIAAWREDDRVVLIHPGAQGIPNALDKLLHALAIVNHKGLRKRIGVLLIGKGGQSDALRKQAKILGLDNVAFFDSVPMTDAQSLCTMCDAGYLGAHERPTIYSFGISPNKIMDYMLAGLPVVIGFRAEHNPVAAADCGVISRSDSPHDIAQALTVLLEKDRVLLREMGARGQRFVLEQHRYGQLANRFLGAISASA